MPTILTGDIAMLLYRLGAASNEPQPAMDLDELLASASVPKDTVARIRWSLLQGPARDWLHSRGFDIADRLRECAEEIPNDISDRDETPLRPVSLPLEFIVTHHKYVKPMLGITPHHLSLPFPKGSFLPVSREIGLDAETFITSPAAALAVYASGHSLPATVLQGFALCGTYALTGGTGACSYRVAPASGRQCLREGIRAFAEHWQRVKDVGVRHSHVLKRCFDSLDYVLDGSASPMESRVASLLVLPERHGGYGFRGLTLNHRVEIDDAGRGAVGKPYLLIDGWFEHAGVGYEYDSDEFHGMLGDEKLREDRKRVEAARAAGMRILSLTRSVLNNAEAFEGFCADLCRLQGLPYHPITDWNYVTRAKLRKAYGISDLSRSPSRY